MITIHEKLWVVKGRSRDVEGSNYLLAYMTHQEYTKDGDKSSTFNKRQDTGRGWAGNKDITDNEIYFDNSSVYGFRIIGSVTRWSTSNKLIQVEDPRGFVVEIPTGNLTTLLKHTVVDKGVVKEGCVWGREDSNHILLPINSEVYQTARVQTKQNNEKVSLTKLKIGQVVKFSVDDKYDYVYLGRGKAVWEVQTKSSTECLDHGIYRYSSNKSYKRNEFDTIIKTETLVDDKLSFIFKIRESCKKELPSWHSSDLYLSTGKCIITGEIEEASNIKVFNIAVPNRLIDDALLVYNRDNQEYNTYKTIQIETKE